ncbi:mucin-2-like isoform X2 [Paramacrobiotus metropolitanus]|uniref:mucin-2-like isoform X2 n=1 Tax=Paramacrobiotus metropolitanus TaxID=2943436 RepID=UPI0024464FFF|nr:mucin-2-like isoform X2 [Paramacrobiotus metropolitanus]
MPSISQRMLVVGLCVVAIGATLARQTIGVVPAIPLTRTAMPTSTSSSTNIPSNLTTEAPRSSVSSSPGLLINATSETLINTTTLTTPNLDANKSVQLATGNTRGSNSADITTGSTIPAQTPEINLNKNATATTTIPTINETVSETTPLSSEPSTSVTTEIKNENATESTATIETGDSHENSTQLNGNQTASAVMDTGEKGESETIPENQKKLEINATDVTVTTFTGTPNGVTESFTATQSFDKPFQMESATTTIDLLGSSTITPNLNSTRNDTELSSEKLSNISTNQTTISPPALPLVTSNATHLPTDLATTTVISTLNVTERSNNKTLISNGTAESPVQDSKEPPQVSISNMNPQPISPSIVGGLRHRRQLQGLPIADSVVIEDVAAPGLVPLAGISTGLGGVLGNRPTIVDSVVMDDIVAPNPGVIPGVVGGVGGTPTIVDTITVEDIVVPDAALG